MSSNTGPTPPKKLISHLLEDDEDLRDVVEEFVASLPERLNELQSAYARLDWDTLTMLAHRLKGAGGSYGYPDLSSLGAAMEAEFKAHQAAEFKAWSEQLHALAEAAKAGLN